MATSSTITDLIQNDLLNCKVCLNRFKHPKMLPCAHTYCQSCLESMMGPNRKIHCPECREEVDLSGGVGKLRTNFHINSLLDIFESKESEEVSCTSCVAAGKSKFCAVVRCQTCLVYLCTLCKIIHLTTFPTHTVSCLPGFNSSSCEAEAMMQKKIYCQLHPKALVNYFCHTCNSVICTSCFYIHAKHRKVPLAGAVETIQPLVMKLVGRLKTDVQSLVQQEQDLNEAMNQIKVTECSLISMIESTLTEVLNNLIKQGDTIKATLSDYVREQEELCKVTKANLQLQIKKAEDTREFSEQVLQSGKAREIVCLQSIVEDLVNANQALNRPPEHKASPNLTVNESVNNIISQSNLFSLTFGETPKAKATPAGNERQKTPLIPQPKQKAFSLHCFNTNLQNDEYDPKLTGISISRDGDIIVVDEENSVLKWYSIDGYLKVIISLPDEGEAPCSVAIFDYTIACSASNRLYLLEMDGTLVKKLNLRGSESAYPIAAYEDEYVAVSEGTLCSLSLYDVNGHVVSRVKPCGYEGVRFLFLAINSSEEFIVADIGKKCIVIFNKHGLVFTVCDQLTMHGVNCALNPYSICTDKDDNILVTQRNRILLFWPDGTFRQELLSTADGLHKPRVIAVDHSYKLIVAQGNGFISVFKLDLF
ncbi:E3 ubiquitin-protein ligase TRIM56-like isoform X1 [Narcine bancroftii]|uniref:E3 ubiquitin-protein ligase TRIM56-like isoform X1 n=1 Tax=Narcine bancroftii TaxID=1343680 RepID=UPI0038312FEF